MEEWVKKIHVKSSMTPKEGQFAMFVGRWQPLHDGHILMFRKVLDENKNILICIREVQIDENNPFDSESIKNNILEVFSNEVLEGRVKVMVIPDISSIEFGRNVGYDIIEHIPPSDIASISATKIREKMRNK